MGLSTGYLTIIIANSHEETSLLMFSFNPVVLSFKTLNITLTCIDGMKRADNGIRNINSNNYIN